MMQFGENPPDPLVIRRLGEQVIAELRVVNEGAPDQLEERRCGDFRLVDPVRHDLRAFQPLQVGAIEKLPQLVSQVLVALAIFVLPDGTEFRQTLSVIRFFRVGYLCAAESVDQYMQGWPNRFMLNNLAEADDWPQRWIFVRVQCRRVAVDCGDCNLAVAVK